MVFISCFPIPVLPPCSYPPPLVVGAIHLSSMRFFCFERIAASDAEQTQSEEMQRREQEDAVHRTTVLNGGQVSSNPNNNAAAVVAATAAAQQFQRQGARRAAESARGAVCKASIRPPLRQRAHPHLHCNHEAVGREQFPTANEAIQAGGTVVAAPEVKSGCVCGT